MGAVYRALDRELDEEVALKVLEAPGEGTAGEQQLRREIKLARTITHPNVVRAYDFGESEGVRFFTMEYVAGATLRELLDEEGRLALTPALQIAKQMCRGLGAVHRAGIVHRDLKPANVMVTEGSHIKVMDFGLATRLPMPVPAEHGDSGLRDTHEHGDTRLMLGTPAYMSPEQASGEPVDRRSDPVTTWPAPQAPSSAIQERNRRW
jgi:serine/threonine-protein kinase